MPNSNVIIDPKFPDGPAAQRQPLGIGQSIAKKGRLKLSKAERATLGEIDHRPGLYCPHDPWPTFMPAGRPVRASAVTDPMSRGDAMVVRSCHNLDAFDAIDQVAIPVLCDPIIKGVPFSNLRTTLWSGARYGFDM